MFIILLHFTSFKHFDEHLFLTSLVFFLTVSTQHALMYSGTRRLITNGKYVQSFLRLVLESVRNCTLKEYVAAHYHSRQQRAFF